MWWKSESEIKKWALRNVQHVSTLLSVTPQLPRRPLRIFWLPTSEVRQLRFLFFQSLQIGCNHVRSIQLFTESIQRTKCPFMSITCDSYESFKKGKCARCNRDGNSCIRFGFHSRPSYQALVEQGLDESSPIATYLLTADKDPFCSAHYKMSVKVSGSLSSLWNPMNSLLIGWLFRIRFRGKSETRRRNWRFIRSAEERKRGVEENSIQFDTDLLFTR